MSARTFRVSLERQFYSLKNTLVRTCLLWNSNVMLWKVWYEYEDLFVA